VTAACNAALLFKAAVRKEHFNPSTIMPGPRTAGVKCYDGWAVAAIDRPNVGMTDGDTLFRARGATWLEYTSLANGAVECFLESLGISAAVSAVLADGVKGAAEAGCTTPLHGLATKKSVEAFSRLLFHLPYQSAAVGIIAENIPKQVELVVTIDLSQSDLSQRASAIAGYKRQAVQFMESFGVNPGDYLVRYVIQNP
jgi:hypothetical protein